jgi:hypothetical protein
MDGWTIGADIGAMLTGLSVLTATIVWTRNQWRDLRAERAETRLRNWHGYIMTGLIREWYVRLAEDPQTVTGRVVLDVVGRDGNPDGNGAASMRDRIAADGQLARAPTPDEYAFLRHLQKERERTGFPVGVDQPEAGTGPGRIMRWPPMRR